MRPASFAGLAFTLATLGGAASAQTTTHPPAGAYPPPRYLPGFTHPAITQCQTINAGRRECTVPANVGGGYLIEAAGFATSTAPDAAIAMNITVGDQVCVAETGGKFTGRGYVHLICDTTLATDTAIKIAVNVEARGATLDAGGPKVVIGSLPWDGVVSVRGSVAGALPTTPAAPAKTPPARPGH